MHAEPNLSGNKNYYNLKNASLDEFKDCIFNHKVYASYDRWYWYQKSDIDFDPNRNVELYIELFKNSSQLVNEFSKIQLEAGFWFMPDSIDGDLCTLIYDRYSLEYNLPIEPKEKLIHSMYDLFKNLFQIDPILGRACYMWWDSVAFNFSPRLNRMFPESNKDHKRIQDAMFETLKKILYLDSLACQISAAHGINHLHHPDTRAVLTQFLDEHPELDEKTRTYVIGCMTGNSM